MASKEQETGISVESHDQQRPRMPQSLFRLGIPERLFHRPIEFDKPKTKQKRRTHFDARDWAKLTRFLREWLKEAGTGKGGGKVRERVLLTNYILIFANTGIRVGEARKLRWRDIAFDKDKQDHPSWS